MTIPTFGIESHFRNHTCIVVFSKLLVMMYNNIKPYTLVIVVTHDTRQTIISKGYVTKRDAILTAEDHCWFVVEQVKE